MLEQAQFDSDPRRLDAIERDYVRWYPARVQPISQDEAWRQRSLGLYVHVPFCAYRCHFCRYKVLAGSGVGAQVGEFLAALRRELEVLSTRPQLQNAELNVVFVGGGTPSMLAEAELTDLLALVRQRFSLAAGCEFTVECNPSSIEEGKLHALRVAGVNRLSIGVQSLHDDILQRIGRDHTAAQAREAVRSAHRAGFENVNIDMIYRLPGQTVRDLETSLADALRCRPTHLSLYPLWVREGTALHAELRRGELRLPSEDEETAMLLCAEELLRSAGFTRYNVFDFSVSTSTHCRYTYLQWEDGSWVGAGPSAISYLDGQHLINAHSLQEYLARVRMTGCATVAGANLSAMAKMRRTMMFGLRMLPFDCKRFERQYGIPVDTIFGEQLVLLESTNLIERTGSELRLTMRGMQQVNNIGKLFYEDPDARQVIGVTASGSPIEESDY